jgi:hypothetical protein
LPSNIHMQIHRLIGGIYEVSAEMGSVSMIYLPSFMKTGLVIQNLIGGIHRHTAWIDSEGF